MTKRTTQAERIEAVESELNSLRKSLGKNLGNLDKSLGSLDKTIRDRADLLLTDVGASNASVRQVLSNLTVKVDEVETSVKTSHSLQERSQADVALNVLGITSQHVFLALTFYGLPETHRTAFKAQLPDDMDLGLLTDMFRGQRLITRPTMVNTVWTSSELTQDGANWRTKLADAVHDECQMLLPDVLSDITAE